MELPVHLEFSRKFPPLHTNIVSWGEAGFMRVHWMQLKCFLLNSHSIPQWSGWISLFYEYIFVNFFWFQINVSFIFVFSLSFIHCILLFHSIPLRLNSTFINSQHVKNLYLEDLRGDADVKMWLIFLKNPVLTSGEKARTWIFLVQWHNSP